MLDFLKTWADAIRNVTLILTGLGMLVTLIIRMNKMKDIVEKIPDLITKVDSISSKIKKVADETENNKKALDKISKDLSKHCEDGAKKNVLILDVARQILLNEIETSIHYKFVSANRRTVVGQLYEAYRENGGNGPIHQMWDVYMELPIEPEDGEKQLR